MTPESGIKTQSTPAVHASVSSIEERVVALAGQLLEAARQRQTAAERREAENMARLMKDPPGKAFTFAMVDEVFRSTEARIRARRWRELLRDYGCPQYPPALDRLLIRAGAAASVVLPGAVMSAVQHRMRADSARVILPGEPGPLHDYLKRRKQDGFRINLNHLGEAVLGEQEAAHRLETVLAHLADPAVDYISVKISAIFSQINLLAWDATLTQIRDRLRLLYRSAMERGKFMNLDMEEYRDLALTLEAFRSVLDEPEFEKLSAGVVLQAYLPDSWNAQQSLTEWARQRVAAGGSPVKIRLVKGANLAMESVEAEMHGWSPAPYATKEETDANFRRMMEYGSRPENAAAARLGVGSHNLFDIALALTLRAGHGTGGLVEIEMLEGMANHQARAVRDAASGVLLYAPAVLRDDFLSAMAYLMRRLDENTAPENFLHDMFNLQQGSPAWERQRMAFVSAWRKRLDAGSASRRAALPHRGHDNSGFHNEPDSDWTQLSVRQSLATALQGWKPVPLPPLEELEAVMGRAVTAHESWRAVATGERAAVLRRAADVMAAQRFQTLACLRMAGKKAVTDADPEISEAIDFARYYAQTGIPLEGLRAEPAGVTVIAPPWNFPYAIPCGGVLAALIAGNAVILKPAPETVEIAWLLAQQLWEGGVPREAMQFYPCSDGAIGQALITDPRVGCVVLTGAYETARLFLKWRPSLRLIAETSGKNALIITAQADRELAIKDLVRSAFGHAGQKCSAASLAIIFPEVYDDPVFHRQLRDAAASLPVGPSTDPRSVVTPLMREAGDPLHRALTTLEPGEEWLLQPVQDAHDPCLWSPGIKLGVQPGSWFHQTECFGPILGLMRADSLEQSLTWQNATDYGLTAGIHSLDPAEVCWWEDRVEAGNLYINRPITGAIVQRQPFGGWKRSCLGPGAKAGGPNYVRHFLRLSDAAEATPEQLEESYRAAWSGHFSLDHDPSGLRAEGNVFRYRRCRGVILRMENADDIVIRRARLAAEITGAPLTVSLRSEESDADFITRLPRLAKDAEFLRTITTPPDPVLAAAYDAGLNWIDAPLTASGRNELRYWLREQAVSQTRHRYGQIPDWQPDMP